MKLRVYMLLACLLAAQASAELIVDLTPGSADYDSSVSGNGVVGVTDPNHNLGLTFNISFQPAALDVATGAAAAINLLEIGGNANGTGLYLYNGEMHFLSKMQGVAADEVSTFNDLDFSSGNNMIGVKAGFGALTAGTTYTAAVVYDPLGPGTLQLALKAGSGPVVEETYSLLGVGTKNSWSGNDTFTSFISPSNAGGGNTVAAHPFNEATMPAFAGTRGQALYWNSTASVIPEPGSAGLMLLGFGALVASRRLRR